MNNKNEIVIAIESRIEKHAELGAHYVGLAQVSNLYENAAAFALKAAAEYQAAAALAALRIFVLPIAEKDNSRLAIAERARAMFEESAAGCAEAKMLGDYIARASKEKGAPILNN